MNNLSWLLYIGNVAGNMGPLFVIFGFLWVVLAFIIFFVWMEKTYRGDIEFPVTKMAAICFAVCINWTLAALCPSQSTVYAIAASQIGEAALKTPLAGKAGQALEAWLDKQIADNKGDK